MKRTVLILGAGASCDFGLPTGDGLSKKIESHLTFRDTSDGNVSGSWAIMTQGNRQPGAVDFFRAAARLAAALPYSTSVDDVLYKFGNDQSMIEAGKAGIVTTILEAEKNSWLMQACEPQNNPVAVLRARPDVWLHGFLRFVQSNTPVAMAGSAFDGLSIIDFNYDRCLEHYLYCALQPAFAIDANQAAEIVNGLKILHPYGTVGRLPWQEVDLPEVPFGRDPGWIDLFAISNSIRTFTEQHDEGMSKEAQTLISEAQQIVFMGFGFHGQNMALIGPRGRDYSSQVYATTLNTSAADQNVFSMHIADCIFGGAQRFVAAPTPTFANVDCGEFIKRFGLSLFRG